ncbi:MAG: hypothetical protein WCX64_00385, partial [Candidatus Micrarchaeia archaeon]
QGAFEYILMLSGVLLIVILIIFILQGTLAGTNNTMAAQQNTFNSSVTIDIVPQYIINLTVTIPTGGVTGPSFPCCALNNGTLASGSATGYNSTCGVTGGQMMTACNSTLNCPTSKFDRKTGKCV